MNKCAIPNVFSRFVKSVEAIQDWKEVEADGDGRPQTGTRPRILTSQRLAEQMMTSEAT